MILKKLFVSLVSLVVLASCNAPKIAFAPLIHPKTKQVVSLKPKAYKITEKTPKSETQKIVEQGCASIAKKEFIVQHFGPLGEEQGLQVGIFGAVGFEKTDKQKKDGAIISLLYVKYIGIPQEQIDSFIPKIQTAAYKDFAKVCNFETE